MGRACLWTAYRSWGVDTVVSACIITDQRDTTCRPLSRCTPRDRLAHIAESILSILYPLRWQQADPDFHFVSLT